MNTAVRILTNRGIALWELPIAFTREQLMVLGLSLSVLLSGLGLVYQKDVNRRLTNQVETMQMQNVQLHNRWTQLLLQKSSLANQSRVATLAHQNFDMQMPASSAVVIVDEK